METKAVATRKFYDRQTRSWIIMLIDADGNQVGDAEYVGSGKTDAELVERQMLATLNEPEEDD